MRNVYIVISQTGTLTSGVIQYVTKGKYCHTSVSLEPSLARMYSFGRRYSFTPLFGGYVRESPTTGVFQRYPKTDVVVLRFPVEKERHRAMQAYLEGMSFCEKRWKYNYFGALLAKFGKKRSKKNAFYCTEFARDFLVRFHICEKEALPEACLPIHFLSAFGDKEIYRGGLREYCRRRAEEDVSEEVALSKI